MSCQEFKFDSVLALFFRFWTRSIDCELVTFVCVICREVYMSFGGLLMLLKGDYTNLKPLKLDSRYYLLIRKV